MHTVYTTFTSISGFKLWPAELKQTIVQNWEQLQMSACEKVVKQGGGRVGGRERVGA